MKDLSRALFALAKLIAPKNRKRWIEAIAAESYQVPSNRKILFAFGAVEFSLTAIMEEMMNNKISAGSFVIMLCSAFLTFVGISNSFRNFAQDPTVSVAFGSMGALWLAVFVTAMLRRWDVLIRVASGGLAASIALGVAWLISVPAFSANQSIFGALALEAIFLFTMLLAASALVRKFALPSS